VRFALPSVKGNGHAVTANPTRREGVRLLLGFVVVSVCAAGFALRSLDLPGIYYDEVIQAQPALDFLKGDLPAPIPGRSSTQLFGRWFPVMTQPYMGALKSQALIPTFALFDARPSTLRATTWVWTLFGVLLAMLWAHQLLGLPTALLAGAMLALDPSVLFIGRHDWGSFALGFVCRCGGLWLLTSGWRRKARGRLLAAGLCFGLGLYNKVDFAVFLASATLALLLVAPRLACDALRTRPRAAIPVLVGLALGAAPMLASLPAVFSATRALASQTLTEDWGEKAYALATALDGSYFQRLMLAGGRFADLASVDEAVAGPFLALFAAATVFLGARVARARSELERDRGRTFVLAASLLMLLGILLTPRAVRIHHVLTAVPFPHLIVAAALVELWKLGATRVGLRALAVALAALALGGSAFVDAHTLATIERTGGKGRWSDALQRLASQLESRPRTPLVALDWGFAEPLRFLASNPPVVESVWGLREARIARRELRFEGTPAHLYLVYPERYAVFGFGVEFLEALRELPADAVEIRPQLDRCGDPAFLAVRIAKSHRLEYRRKLEVSLR
jgi:hypothetical protein